MILMDDGARKWTARIAKQNFWRVWRWYEFDDLIQDGVMQWYRLCERYPNVTERPHMMRLYQITYLNWITDIAKKRTRQPQEVLSCEITDALDDTFLWEWLGGMQPELGTFLVRLKRAPQPIKQFLQAVFTEKGVRMLRAPYRIRAVGRETRNERLCRIAGLNPQEHDLCAALVQYFREDLK